MSDQDPGIQPRYIPSPPTPSQVPSAARGTNALAIAALVLGILSILVGLGCWCLYGVAGPVLGIPAIILGHIGKRQISESGGVQRGRGLAQAGFITGIVGTILGVLAFLIMISIGIASLSNPSNF